MIILFDQCLLRFANSWTCLNAGFIRASRLWLTPICCAGSSCKHPSCGAHCDTGTQHITVKWYLQSASCPALGPISPRPPFNCLQLNCFTALWIPFFSTLFYSLSHTHIETQTHARAVSGPESGRAAAKGLTEVSWREVTALCITRWHWQLTDG